jgi:hypothetical protein
VSALRVDVAGFEARRLAFAVPISANLALAGDSLSNPRGLRLVELELRFVRYYEVAPVEMDIADSDYASSKRTHKEMRMQRWIKEVAALAEAQGIMFLCPKCYAKNGGAVGTHGVDVTFAGRGVPDLLGSHGDAGAPSRWAIAGTGHGDLTMSPSILLLGGCGWHGFITNGEVTST